MFRHDLRWVSSVVVLSMVFCFGACSDDIKVESVLKPPDNRPPRIVLIDPQNPTAPIEDLNGYGAGVILRVLVADPDGLDDISAVLLSVDAVNYRKVIVRPDIGLPQLPQCGAPSFSPNDTVSISQLIPAHLPGPKNAQMFGSGGGLYTMTVCFSCTLGNGQIGIPPIRTLNTAFGPPSKTCGVGEGSLEWFGIYPPAVDVQEDVYITYMDTEIEGIRVTVYDGSGLSATETFPNQRLIVTTREEQQAAP